MNVLILYNSTQTYTGTVFEHLACFRHSRRHRYFFAHHDGCSALGVDLGAFDAVIVHYSIRLPFDQIGEDAETRLRGFPGLKGLFIQDEYDHPQRAWRWMRRLGIHLVFTVVPEAGIPRVYPPGELPGVRFVSVLTGYVPDEMAPTTVRPPSKRPLIVGYRGRNLPIRYGALGREKVGIGRMVAEYCRAHGLPHDIAWSEEARIYGARWYEFVASCRSMLGSESGSNVFDWDGSLGARIQEFKARLPRATDEEIYEGLLRPLEVPGLMNQVSPRVFESIAARTVLVLLEGRYSGVVEPGVHFLPVEKDGRNLDDVFRRLADGSFVDGMAERAYQDVIASGAYSYRSFVARVDEELSSAFDSLLPGNEVTPGTAAGSGECEALPPLTTCPLRARPPQPPTDTLTRTIRGADGPREVPRRLARYLWGKVPVRARSFLKPRIVRLLGWD